MMNYLVTMKSVTEDNMMRHALVWLLTLQKIDSSSTLEARNSKNGLENGRFWRVRNSCSEYLSSSGILNVFLDFILKSKMIDTFDMSGALQQIKPSEYASGDSANRLFIYGVFRAVCLLPVLVRKWWSSGSKIKMKKDHLQKFIEESVSNALIRREVSLIEDASKFGLWNSDEMTVKGNSISREFSATIAIDETRHEMKIKLPAAYPLQIAEVEYSSRLGIAEKRWRGWVLQIIQLLSSQDGSIVDAITLWYKNVKKELDGLQPCPICYCIVHPKNTSLPKMTCKTCSNKFHSVCLTQWWGTSGKNECVMCRQPFY